jgi:hypothetical protein
MRVSVINDNSVTTVRLQRAGLLFTKHMAGHCTDKEPRELQCKNNVIRGTLVPQTETKNISQFIETSNGTTLYVSL